MAPRWGISSSAASTTSKSSSQQNHHNHRPTPPLEPPHSPPIMAAADLRPPLSPPSSPPSAAPHHHMTSLSLALALQQAEHDLAASLEFLQQQQQQQQQQPHRSKGRTSVCSGLFSEDTDPRLDDLQRRLSQADWDFSAQYLAQPRTFTAADDGEDDEEGMEFQSSQRPQTQRPPPTTTTTTSQPSRTKHVNKKETKNKSKNNVLPRQQRGAAPPSHHRQRRPGEQLQEKEQAGAAAVALHELASWSGLLFGKNNDIKKNNPNSNPQPRGGGGGSMTPNDDDDDDHNNKNDDDDAAFMDEIAGWHDLRRAVNGNVGAVAHNPHGKDQGEIRDDWNGGGDSDDSSSSHFSALTATSSTVYDDNEYVQTMQRELAILEASFNAKHKHTHSPTPPQREPQLSPNHASAVTANTTMSSSSQIMEHDNCSIDFTIATSTLASHSHYHTYYNNSPHDDNDDDNRGTRNDWGSAMGVVLEGDQESRFQQQSLPPPLQAENQTCVPPPPPPRGTAATAPPAVWIEVDREALLVQAQQQSQQQQSPAKPSQATAGVPVRPPSPPLVSTTTSLANRRPAKSQTPAALMPLSTMTATTAPTAAHPSSTATTPTATRPTSTTPALNARVLISDSFPILESDDHKHKSNNNVEQPKEEEEQATRHKNDNNEKSSQRLHALMPFFLPSSSSTPISNQMLTPPQLVDDDQRDSNQSALNKDENYNNNGNHNERYPKRSGGQDNSPRCITEIDSVQQLKGQQPGNDSPSERHWLENKWFTPPRTTVQDVTTTTVRRSSPSTPSNVLLGTPHLLLRREQEEQEQQQQSSHDLCDEEQQQEDTTKNGSLFPSPQNKGHRSQGGMGLLGKITQYSNRNSADRKTTWNDNQHLHYSKSTATPQPLAASTTKNDKRENPAILQKQSQPVSVVVNRVSTNSSTAVNECFSASGGAEKKEEEELGNYNAQGSRSSKLEEAPQHPPRVQQCNHGEYSSSQSLFGFGLFEWTMSQHRDSANNKQDDDTESKTTKGNESTIDGTHVQPQTASTTMKEGTCISNAPVTASNNNNNTQERKDVVPTDEHDTTSLPPREQSPKSLVFSVLESVGLQWSLSTATAKDDPKEGQSSIAGPFAADIPKTQGVMKDDDGNGHVLATKMGQEKISAAADTKHVAAAGDQPSSPLALKQQDHNQKATLVASSAQRMDRGLSPTVGRHHHHHVDTKSGPLNVSEYCCPCLAAS